MDELNLNTTVHMHEVLSLEILTCWLSTMCTPCGLMSAVYSPKKTNMSWMVASYGRPLNLTQSRTSVNAAVGGTNVGGGTTYRFGDGATGINGADEYRFST